MQNHLTSERSKEIDREEGKDAKVGKPLDTSYQRRIEDAVGALEKMVQLQRKKGGASLAEDV